MSTPHPVPPGGVTCPSPSHTAPVVGACPVRLLLAIDQPVMRAAVRALLAHHWIEIVGETDDPSETIANTRALGPDVVLVDLSTENERSYRTACDLHRLPTPTPGILVLIEESSPLSSRDVLEELDVILVPKQSSPDVLLRAVRCAGSREFLRGHGYPACLPARRPPEPPNEPASLLTTREKQVLAMTAAGFSSPEVGARLGISPKSVSTYQARYKNKLKLDHIVDIRRFAIRAGLLDLGAEGPESVWSGPAGR